MRNVGVILWCENFSLTHSALCNQEPDTESCGIRERAFFYNATTRRCERFVYGGCERTHHRFSSLSECWGTCHGIRDMCATIRCPAGTRCKINEQNGNAFCEASCEYENGGCSDSEICRMRPVQCITAPCFEVVECVSRRGKKSDSLHKLLLCIY